MQKNKRPSGREEFERVYLRENQIKRSLQNLSSAEVDDHLKNKEFIKTTAYIARKTFYKNKSFLLSHGFEQEDLESISQIYGLSFLSSNFGNKTGKDKYYLMMRYINQRFEAFFLFFNRKFDISIKIPEVSIEQTGVPVAELAHYESNLIQNEPMSEDDFFDQIDLTKKQIKLIKAKSLDKSLLKQEKQELLKKKTLLLKSNRSLKEQLQKIKQKNKKNDREQKSRSLALKKRFSENWEQYKDQLCYYSTSRHVPNDVRKKARSFCKKYKVDFVAWAKNKIKTNSETEYDFVIS